MGQGGIKAYSEETNQVDTLIDSPENLSGVAWDPIDKKLYFCQVKAIYRANYDGSNVQTVFQTNKCKFLEKQHIVKLETA